MAGDHTDVVIVGGGIAGAAAARWLAPDHDVRLLERHRIAGEATGPTCEHERIGATLNAIGSPNTGR